MLLIGVWSLILLKAQELKDVFGEDEDHGSVVVADGRWRVRHDPVTGSEDKDQVSVSAADGRWRLRHGPFKGTEVRISEWLARIPLDSFDA